MSKTIINITEIPLIAVENLFLKENNDCLITRTKLD